MSEQIKLYSVWLQDTNDQWHLIRTKGMPCGTSIDLDYAKDEANHELCTRDEMVRVQIRHRAEVVEDWVSEHNSSYRSLKGE